MKTAVVVSRIWGLSHIFKLETRTRLESEFLAASYSSLEARINSYRILRER
jgi:hypothetical protein